MSQEELGSLSPDPETTEKGLLRTRHRQTRSMVPEEPNKETRTRSRDRLPGSGGGEALPVCWSSASDFFKHPKPHPFLFPAPHSPLPASLSILAHTHHPSGQRRDTDVIANAHSDPQRCHGCRVEDDKATFTPSVQQCSGSLVTPATGKGPKASVRSLRTAISALESSQLSFQGVIPFTEAHDNLSSSHFPRS